MPDRVNIAYVLRMWRESPNSSWRISLVNAETTQQRYFARLRELVVFLELLTGETVDSSAEEAARGAPSAKLTD